MKIITGDRCLLCRCFFLLAAVASADSGKSHAEAYEKVVEEKLKHTYASTAMRMLGEIGGIREGTCIDIGCGTGNLDIELAKRSEFTITGLDIDPGMKPLFERRVNEAGMQDRIRFVIGDAQQLPFPDDSADVVISRGALTFIPDLGKCLREVDRILKPTGVAFMGGRYLYTPEQYKITNEKFKTMVEAAGVPNAEVIEERGQWVKIVGPEAPQAANRFQPPPEMFAARVVGEYAIVEGECLVVCLNDKDRTQGLQRGLMEMTELRLTALYSSEKTAAAARERIKEAGLSHRISCKAGKLDALPFGEASFELVTGTGPMLLNGDRQKKMSEVHRVLRPGGAALLGGRYLVIPEARRVTSEALCSDAAATGIKSIRVYDDMGQWVEIRKEGAAVELLEKLWSDN